MLRELNILSKISSINTNLTMTIVPLKYRIEGFFRRNWRKFLDCFIFHFLRKYFYFNNFYHALYRFFWLNVAALVIHYIPDTLAKMVNDLNGMTLILYFFDIDNFMFKMHILAWLFFGKLIMLSSVLLVLYNIATKLFNNFSLIHKAWFDFRIGILFLIIFILLPTVGPYFLVRGLIQDAIWYRRFQRLYFQPWKKRLIKRYYEWLDDKDLKPPQ